MNPIENAKFSDDFQKFVLQNDVRVVKVEWEPPRKPFSLDPPSKSDKSKKEDPKKDKEPHS